jgi:hypothetical protein
VDGRVSLNVSLLLAYDTASTLAAAKDLHTQAGRANLLIKIPGTKEGLPAIEEAIFAGVPINVTLLFSREDYVAAAGAYLRGIERRIAAGLNPDVGSVASVFISRWDASVMDKVPDALRDRLGIAIAKRTYKASNALLGSPRWLRVYNAGGSPATPAVGQHGNQGSQGVRRPLRQSPRRAFDGEHHARGNSEIPRRPRRTRLNSAGGRWRLRGGVGRARQGRGRH